jgi:hypothetical protein
MKMVERFNKLDRFDTDLVLSCDILGERVTAVIDESTGYCSYSMKAETDKEHAVNHKATVAAVREGTLVADEPGDHDDGA